MIVVTTRAAAMSLPPGDGQVGVAVQRGIQLLDGLADEVEREGSAEAREQLAQGRRELAVLLEEDG